MLGNIKTHGWEMVHHSGANQAIAAATWTKLLNDGAGVSSDTSQLPYGVTCLYDTVNNTLDLNDIEGANTVLFRFNFQVTPTINNTICKIRIKWTPKDENGNPLGNFYINQKMPTLDEGLVAHDIAGIIPLTIGSIQQGDGSIELELYTNNASTVTVAGYKIMVV